MSSFEIICLTVKSDKANAKIDKKENIVEKKKCFTKNPDKTLCFAKYPDKTKPKSKKIYYRFHRVLFRFLTDTN
jgi:hypothetical protein